MESTDSQYKSLRLNQLLAKVTDGSLALPHIQRAFVWEPERVCKLMDSLMKGYPLQPFMFWNTKSAVRVRIFQKIIEEDIDLSLLYDGLKSSQNDLVKELVLDGQQRIQSLYAVFCGGFKAKEGTAVAWLNLAHEGTIDGEDRFAFSVVNPGAQAGNKTAPDVCWLQLRRLLNMKLDELEGLEDTIWAGIQNHFSENPSSSYPKPEVTIVRRNTRRIRSLLHSLQYQYIELDGATTNAFPLKKVIEIFVRVNSGSVKLEPSELMFATLKGGWPEAEEEIEDVKKTINTCENVNLSFETETILRCISLGYEGTCKIDEDSFQDLETMERWKTDWPTAKEAFGKLSDVIKHDLKLYHERTIPGYSTFLPMFSYIYARSKEDTTGLTEVEKRSLFAFYYLAQILGWFSSQTDSKVDGINKLLTSVKSRAFPLKEILGVVGSKSEGGFNKPTLITGDSINTPSRRSIVLNLAYVASGNPSPFNVASPGNKPDIDHIYPKKLLLDLFAKELPNMDTKAVLKEINHIGNFRLIGSSENRRRKHTPADEYFAELVNSGIDIKRHILIEPYSSDPAQLKLSLKAFRDFRDARASKILDLAVQATGSHQ